jgi:hypothetical protein
MLFCGGGLLGMEQRRVGLGMLDLFELIVFFDGWWW